MTNTSGTTTLTNSGTITDSTDPRRRANGTNGTFVITKTPGPDYRHSR